MKTPAFPWLLACVCVLSAAVPKVTAQSTGAVAGRVSNAVNGQPLAGATVRIAGNSTVTDAQGNYLISGLTQGSLAASFTGGPQSGNAPLTVTFTNLSANSFQTLDASAPGFLAYSNNMVAVQGGVTNRLDFSMSPMLGAGAGTIRIVLNWGARPSDLDSHLQINTAAFNPSIGHVYFANRGSLIGNPFAELDVDDVTSFGPETITIQTLFTGSYHYYIHNWSGTDSFQTSDAVVQVYDTSGLVATFRPPATGAGLYWHVFSLDGTTTNITSINMVTNNPSQPPQPWPGGFGSGTGGTDTGITLSYFWDFGDGNISTNANPVHTYNSPGTYNVQLTVNASDGRVASLTRTAFISVAGALIGLGEDTIHLEGNASTTDATVTVSLAQPSLQTVTLDYFTLDGTATAGADYAATTGTLVFQPGVTTQTITIPVLGDTSIEPNETFLVVLTNSLNAMIGRSQVTVTILDDDGSVLNDGCANAIPITDVPFQGAAATTLASNIDPTLPCVPGFGQGVWYFYVPPVSGFLSINTTNSSFDTGLAVFSGDCGNLTLLACDDDGGGNGFSAINLEVTAGSRYFILAGGRNGASGLLRLNVNLRPFPPAIRQVLPLAQTTGNTVELRGTNFFPSVASNIVHFGAVRAEILAATRTNLILRMPAGATYAPITATVGGSIGYSTLPHTPIFDSTAAINSTTFSERTDYTMAGRPAAVVAGDFNNDGFPDTAVAVSNMNTVAVFRNLTTLGAINPGSLGARVDVGTGAGPVALATSDLDGDGRLDLVIANYQGGTVSVARNASSTTTMAFDTAFNLAAGSNPRAVTIRDLDGDGLPEIVVANEGSGTVSVFRNRGAGGTLNAGSFDARRDYVVGTKPVAVAAGDFNGDSRVDLVVANSFNGPGGNSVAILPNDSQPGALAFASRVSVATGIAPSAVVLGDLNLDGALDLATANSGASSITVLTNTATPGALTAATLVSAGNYSAGSSVRSLAIGDINGDGLPDLVTANEFIGTLSVLRNQSQSIPSITQFAAPMTFSIGVGPIGVAVADLDLNAKPELMAVRNGNLSVLRNLLKSSPGVAWNPPGSPIPYGTSLNASLLNAFSTLSIPGTFVYSPPAGSLLEVGSHTLRVVFVPYDTANFDRATNTVSLTVTQAVLTVTANNLSRAYGAANPVLTGVVVGLQNNDNITAVYSTTASATNPVGGYAIDVTFLDPNNRLGNYDVTTHSGTLTVTQAVLNVAIGSASRVYGNANPAFSAVLSGVANSESFTTTLATAATATSPVNTYPIVLDSITGATIANYTVQSTPGTLTVTHAPLTVTANSASRSYGAANPTFTSVLTGLKNSDNITASFTTTVGQFDAVGVYPNQIIFGSFNDPGGKIGNYTVTAVPATLTVTADDDPLITITGPLAYTENDPPKLLDATATVTDGGSANFDGGRLVVTITANGQASDRLLVRHQGSAAGEIGVSGSTISFGGTAIGTYTGDGGSGPLTVLFNASSSPAAAQALVRNLQYTNTSENPSAATRTLEFLLTDGDGGANDPLATLAIQVTPVNDLPVVAIVTPTQNAKLKVSDPVVIEAQASDVDGSVAQVEFFNGTTSLGTVNSTPWRLVISSLAIGDYALKAVAKDDSGEVGNDSTTSSQVDVTVNPSISGGTINNDGQFEMQFHGVNGVTYDVEVSSDLANWSFIGTVTAGAGATPFVDPTLASTIGQRFYRFVPQVF